MKMKHEKRTQARGAHSHLRYAGDKLGYIDVVDARDINTLLLQGWVKVETKSKNKAGDTGSDEIPNTESGA